MSDSASPGPPGTSGPPSPPGAPGPPASVGPTGPVHPSDPTSPTAPLPSHHGWPQALAVVLTGVLAMALVAGLGLLAAGAGDLPGGAFPAVVAAAVVTAVGGSIELSGGAGSLAGAGGGMTVMPLSVTLTGALAIGAGFLRPLRRRAVASAAEFAGWAARIAVLWLLALLGLALGSRHTFRISLGGTVGGLADLFGVNPAVGFKADVPVTLAVGLCWLAGVLLLALLVARGAPLPARLLRWQETVRPVSSAVLALLLAWVALGTVVALVVAATRGRPTETLAVVLLGMPNLMWPAFTLGLGATWDGRVRGPFGLPMPHVLDEALRTPDVSAVNVRTLAAQDSRVWSLVAVGAVLVLAAAFLAARRSPARMRPWQHAVHLALALAAAVLMVCLLCQVSARYGLSLLGIGDLGGNLGGQLFLRPRLWTALGLAVVWGLVAGFLGAVLTRKRR